MIERGGEVVIRMLENVQQVTIKPLIQAMIVSGALVYTDEYDISIAVWRHEATITRAFAIVQGSTLAMTMATAFVKSMSTPWKGSGRYYARGCVRIAVSRRPICRCTWAFLSSSITSGDGAKPC
jgi:transposase